MNLLDRLDEKIGRAEQFLVVIFLTAMILVAFSQIVLRNFFSTGIDWGDALVRYLVVWVGFIGAAIATRESKHITIDVLSRWFRGLGSTAVRAICNFFSAVICGLLTLAAIKFVSFEAQMGGTAFFNLPAWVPELVIPASFGMMTLRYFLRLLNDIVKILAAVSSGDKSKNLI
jgi:TRAP-type C4-dicarboxylate transport system permease small subunit